MNVVDLDKLEKLLSACGATLVGVWAVLNGQRTRREEKARQKKIDSAEEETREVKEESDRAKRWQEEAVQWQKEAATARQETAKAQADADAAKDDARKVQELHDNLMAEWIQYGTTRALMIEEAKFRFNQKMN